MNKKVVVGTVVLGAVGAVATVATLVVKQLFSNGTENDVDLVQTEGIEKDTEVFAGMMKSEFDKIINGIAEKYHANTLSLNGRLAEMRVPSHSGRNPWLLRIAFDEDGNLDKHFCANPYGSGRGNQMINEAGKQVKEYLSSKQ